MQIAGGANSTGADLKSDDIQTGSWLAQSLSEKIFAGYYEGKRKLKDKYNLALGTDYMFLNQFASYSFSDRQASSGIFRFFGTWEALNVQDKLYGALVFRIENRHLIGTGLTPRNFGYETGSALSTASFKDFDWGMTNLYWKLIFGRHRGSVIAGIMDVGDWVDLYPLLNAYKYYLNEAFFNSPAMALPNQGLGLAGSIQFISDFYFSGGISDANGELTYFVADNFRSFFDVREYFFWVEAGWDRTGNISDGYSVHLTY